MQQSKGFALYLSQHANLYFALVGQAFDTAAACGAGERGRRVVQHHQRAQEGQGLELALTHHAVRVGDAVQLVQDKAGELCIINY